MMKAKGGRKTKSAIDTSSRKVARSERSVFTPKRTVCLVACAVALGVLFAGDIRRAFQSGFNPRIAFEARAEGQGRRTSRGDAASSQTPIFDGEVYRTEARLREATAVAVAASLASISRSMERRPVASVDDLLAEMARKNLLPPGVEFVAERKLLASERSVIHVRFRPQPFGVEVVALGRERRDGPALLVRVPDDNIEREAQNDQRSQNRARYFYSLRLENITVPEPFAIASRVEAAGWQEDYIRAEVPEGMSFEQLARWTQEQSASSSTQPAPPAQSNQR